MQKTRMNMPAQVKTKLDKMTLLDRFLFNETVEDPEAYNAMVEILMDGHISMIQRSETEKEIRISPQLREIRLDVIGMDEEGILYQMEMQRKNPQNLPKRSRYYQGQIDVSLLEPGCVDFNKLNDLTTILVAPFDLFGHGLYRYTFEGCCQEVPGLKINDGARRIFINTKGKNAENFSEEFLDFMEYINATTDAVAAKSASARIQRIHSRVQSVKSSEKMGVRIMQKWEEMAYARIGGEERGETRVLIRQICRKLRKGLSLERIIEDLEEDTELVSRIYEMAQKYAPDYDEERVFDEYRKSVPNFGFADFLDTYFDD